MYGNGGMNTEFKNSPVFPTGEAPPHHVAPFNAGTTANSGVNLEQLFVSPTLGIKLNDRHSVGISANLVYQQFKAQGLEALARNSGKPTNFTGKGVDSATGIVATIGWMGKVSPNVTMGLSHRFKTGMSGFKGNAPFFSGATAGAVTDGSVDVPGATTLGVSFNASKKTKIAIDLQRIYYSKSKAINLGFGWDDQDVIKVGVKHQLNNKVALLAGINYGKSVITPAIAARSFLVPAVSEKHLSLGADVKLNKNSSLSFAYVHAFENAVSGGGVTVRMAQDSVGIGYSRKF